MKIMIVCSRLSFGGAERVAVLWANGFVNRGNEVVIVSNLLEERTYKVDERIRLYNLVSTNDNKLKKWISAVSNIRNAVKKEHPDVIIGVMGTCSLVAKIATIRINVPIIMTEHYAFERPGMGLSRLENFFKFYINRLYALVTVLTNTDKILIGNRLKNVVVVNNPLSYLPSKQNTTKAHVILAAGRLDGWYVKGFDVLIRAWALVNGQLKIDNGQLSSTGESWKLQIAGTGSEESLNYLKQLCKENGVEDRVEFLGFRNDVEKLYQDASIFVLSSRYEGSGLVLLEAMSQGCACVACDYKGRQREIVCPEGQGSKFNVQGSNSKPETRNQELETRNYKFEACENGILCEPDDVESLAAGIRKMMEDDEYRESVRAKAIERSKYYSIENTIDRWEKLLDKVVN